MADLLPSTSDASGPASDEPRVVGVDSEDADELLAALSSRTARQVLATLHDDPSTPSAVASAVDTSLQNAQYHLEKLEDAGVIEVVDTVYSEKGREMRVYAPSDRALVVVAGRQEETTGLRTTLKRLLGGVGALGIASVVVDRLAGGPTARMFAMSSPPPDGGAQGTDLSTAADAGGAGGAGGGNVTTTVEETYQVAENETVTTTGTPAPTEASTPTGTHAATRTATEAPTGTPVGTETATGTPMPTETATQTPMPTHTPTEVPAATGTPAPEPTTVQQTVETTAGTPIQSGGATPVDLLAQSPGALFFLGGLLALLLVVLVVQYRG